MREGDNLESKEGILLLTQRIAELANLANNAFLKVCYNISLQNNRGAFSVDIFQDELNG